MIIHTAVRDGSVSAYRRAAYDAPEASLVPSAIRRYPRRRDARRRLPVEQEQGATSVYLVFDLHCDDLKAIHAALASPVWQKMRVLIAAAIGNCEGRFYHLVTEAKG